MHRRCDSFVDPVPSKLQRALNEAIRFLNRDGLHRKKKERFKKKNLIYKFEHSTLINLFVQSVKEDL